MTTTDEQFAALKRAFVDGKADFITLDGWSGRWLWEGVWAAEKDGLVKQDVSTSNRQSDDQYTAACFRPTKKFFALADAQPSEPQS